jgi:hypothetical protein
MVKDLDFATAAIEATDTQEAVNSADRFHAEDPPASRDLT